MSLENDLNNLNRDKFISLFGVIFEKTQWIAEKLLEHKPFKNKEDLIYKDKPLEVYKRTDITFSDADYFYEEIRKKL